MSERPFQIGDRVSGGALFGCGNIVDDLCGLPGFWRVHFDRTPPREYTTTGNPCAVTADMIRHATPEDERESAALCWLTVDCGPLTEAEEAWGRELVRRGR